MTRGVPNDSPLVRFQRKCLPVASGCIEWQGRPTSEGYGIFSANYKRGYAHQWSLFFTTGQWPDKFICHRCDNPICVNIEHLFEGTAKDNSQDAANKNHMGRPHSMSAEMRQKIRELCGTISQREIAKLFSTTQATVSEINRGLHEHRNRSQDYK